MENIESSWNILMVINFKILQSKYFINKFSTYSTYRGRKFVNKIFDLKNFKINNHHY